MVKPRSTAFLIQGGKDAAGPIITMKTINAKNFKEHFEQLYQQYAGRLYNYVLKISRGNRYVAEEITQISFLKLWERREHITDSDTMASYLFTIARNTFFNVCEHEAIEYVYFNYILDTQTVCDFSTEQKLDVNFLLEHINELVGEMPDVRRRVFVMSRQYHMSHKQIAESLGISVNTVETHIMLALRYLREQLGRRYGVWMLMLPLLLLQY